MKILLLRALLAGTSSFSFAQSRISATVASKLLTKKNAQQPILPQTKKSSRPNPEFYPSLLSLDKLEKMSLYRSASFLKKAGAPSYLYESEKYSSVVQTADELEIDLLALDDHVVDKQKDGSISVKVGNFLVNIPKRVSIPNLTGNREQDASEFLKVSSWGGKERTRDWAQRIKTVLADYDIVLVYAGNGHLEHPYFTNLQPMWQGKSLL